jgi:hypothetical protein
VRNSEAFRIELLTLFSMGVIAGLTGVGYRTTVQMRVRHPARLPSYQHAVGTDACLSSHQHAVGIDVWLLLYQITMRVPKRPWLCGAQVDVVTTLEALESANEAPKLFRESALGAVENLKSWVEDKFGVINQRVTGIDELRVRPRAPACAGRIRPVSRACVP